MEKDIAYSDSVYEPESLLSNWVVVSGVMVTTGLLFYHMARVNTIKMTPNASKIIAVGMILLSVMYLLYGIIPYNRRMNHVENKCKKDDNCSDDEVKFVKTSYIIIIAITIIIQMIISYVVIKTI